MKETQGLGENKLPIKVGDVVMTCEHTGALREGSSWFKLPDQNVTAVRDNGTSFRPSWARACAMCTAKAGGNPNLIQFGKDYTHDGSEVVLLHPKS